LTWLAALAVATGSRLSGERPQEKVTADMDKLIGTWICIAGAIDGKPIPEETAKQLRLVLTKSTYTTLRGDQTLFESTYSLDPAASPKTIDIVGTEGENAGKAAQGIYEVEGDDLRLCYTMPGRDRPRAFDSKPGSGAYNIVWKRSK
jgi:uncharacterized protein (TIGR03067 family)